MYVCVQCYVQLECVDRVSQTEWKTEVILPSVSFAPLILPSQESVKDLAALEIGMCKAYNYYIRRNDHTLCCTYHKIETAL